MLYMIYVLRRYGRMIPISLMMPSIAVRSSSGRCRAVPRR